MTIVESRFRDGTPATSSLTVATVSCDRRDNNFNMSQKIQIRRGVEAQRALITPDVGELLFTTDNKQLFIGDGATAGGLLVGGGTASVMCRRFAGRRRLRRARTR